MEAHDVEAEAIDFVLARIEHERVDDQLFHHAMFAGGIGTAGAGFHISIRIQPVIVARYDFIEIRIWPLAEGVGVIEDDVLNHT